MLVKIIFISLVIVSNAYQISRFSEKSNQFIPNKNKFDISTSDFGASVTLMRHACTYNNKNNIWTGNLDTPIDYTGQEVFMDNYDLVLSSPAIRCRQTLDLINFKNEPKIIFDDAFLEAGYGRLTAKSKDYNTFRRTFFNKPPESKYYNSESIFDAGLRSYLAFVLLTDEVLKPESKILVLSHKNTLKGLWTFLHLDYNLVIESLEFDELDEDINKIVNKNKIPDFENLYPYKITL